MTDSLIPYSFIPGTKAKAQEVNANFIALANQITENKEYTDSKIDETMSVVNNDRAGTKLDNTNLISNCILDAPNGIITYTGNTITVKNGLRVLIPSGRNEDKSLKSIEHTLSEDILLTASKNANVNCVYITPEGAAIAQFFQYETRTPVYSYGIWYNPVKNMSYIYNAENTSWEELNAVIIASFEIPADTVSNVKIENLIGLLKENDVMAFIPRFMPDYKKAVTKSFNTNHRAVVNGYLHAYLEGQQNILSAITIDGVVNKVLTHPQGHIGYASGFLPVCKGSEYSVTAPRGEFRFIPAKGEV